MNLVVCLQIQILQIIHINYDVYKTKRYSALKCETWLHFGETMMVKNELLGIDSLKCNLDQTMELFPC